MEKSPIYCEHANECPQTCPCPPDCYCKDHSCKTRPARPADQRHEGPLSDIAACPTCHGLKKVQLVGTVIPASVPAAEALQRWPQWHEDCPTCVPRRTARRIAFTGASGTGKTTMATWLSQLLGIPFNPVGSRSVSKAMGFDSPYDVDKAGRRAEFQRRLVSEKRAWEIQNNEFVTDRTTLDNLAYTVFHDIGTIDAALYDQVIGGMERYTHVIYCPVHVFCNPAGDPSRVLDMTYHQLYDTMIEALVQRHQVRNGQRFARLVEVGIEHRRDWLKRFLGV